MCKGKSRQSQPSFEIHHVLLVVGIGSHFETGKAHLERDVGFGSKRLKRSGIH
jgi:hypothetical protein